MRGKSPSLIEARAMRCVIAWEPRRVHHCRYTAYTGFLCAFFVCAHDQQAYTHNTHVCGEEGEGERVIYAEPKVLFRY